jgi:glycogen debranching enzyme
MSEVLRLEDRVYVLATSIIVDDRRAILKDGDTFAVFDRRGDIQSLGLKEQGLFHRGTRFLSQYELLLGNQRPLLLDSLVSNDNCLLSANMTNPDMETPEGGHIRHGTLHVLRTKFLWHGVCYERLTLTNYAATTTQAHLVVRFSADFADIFEVRGFHRERRGVRLEDEQFSDGIVLAYAGLDQVTRRLRLSASLAPSRTTGNALDFYLDVEPQHSRTLFIAATCLSGDEAHRLLPYHQAFSESPQCVRRFRAAECEIETSDQSFNRWLAQSLEDLRLLTVDTPHGPYPFAGIPWFAAPFGRDGIIAALFALWVTPSLARGVLRYLAHHQGATVDPSREEEPGKILHEVRHGELAATREIPFGRYFGSVDSTPLFVILAAAYFEHTGDRATIVELWSSLERALEWIDRYGDVDGDGFYEYASHNPSGLIQQGWKDSHDSVFHVDGAIPRAPIALCEMQGYVYAAKWGGATLADTLGHPDIAARLRAEAAELKRRFNAVFWNEEIGMYALALDGEKRPCLVRTSNAGHCLFTGIAEPERGARVAAALFEQDLFSGWGVRTVSSRCRLYNPMAYHNGSVWPHDNALIALGLPAYGAKERVLDLLHAFMDVAEAVNGYRMPELFCGFARRPEHGITLHPVACSPQAWAATTVLALLKVALGISVDGARGRVVLDRPQLPHFLSEVAIRGLKVGSGTIDLVFTRVANDVGTHVMNRTGAVDVTILK